MVAVFHEGLEWNSNHAKCINGVSSIGNGCLRFIGLWNLLGDSLVPVEVGGSLGGVRYLTKGATYMYLRPYCLWYVVCGRQWDERQVECHCDNTVVTAIVNSGHSKDNTC